ncbi:Pycsar system effector family protein [Agrobacterium rosae]|uniref:Pycsar system effector family protein n=1 Tax=Agrobacterium rosae TaxID=1972867 RepID=UPI000CD98716|nr:Pycsar system effector family protein [Agrobacterium rosae]POO57214.1 hypothetical protein CTT39_00380 [Agrobacterium rosae]
MAKNDQQEAYEKLMSANHARMIDFSKFAEAKNAALLTICSVWMAAITTILRSETELTIAYNYAFKLSLFLLFIAAFVSLKSLMPKFLEQMHRREDDYKNLLYFGDIAQAGTRSYPDMATELYMPAENECATATYLHDLAVQTAIHAKIARRKFNSFNWSASIVLLAFAVMAVPLLLSCIGWAIDQLH